MKLTYWVVNHKGESSAYHIRATTKREALDQIANHWNETNYDKPHKVTIEYKDAFDLMLKCNTEGGAWWELE